MKTRVAVLAGIVLAAAVGSAWAEKPLKDYSFIRGVNYGMYGDQAVLERDLGYAKRVKLNSTRIWLNYQGYEKDPQSYYQPTPELHSHRVSDGLLYDAYSVEREQPES